MSRSKARIALVTLVALSLSAGVVAAGALSNKNTGTRGVVLFVGDSNVVLSSDAITAALSRFTHGNNGYVPVLAARSGAGIRTADCLDPTNCTTFDYWKLRLAGILPKVRADAIVTDFGVIDTDRKGTETTRGYAYFGRKIDWFMNLVGGRPVFWTTLPCALEPSNRRTGCKTVNFELSRARTRWSNLILVDWATAAVGHSDYMVSAGIHYAEKGRRAWANLVVAALDARVSRNSERAGFSRFACVLADDFLGPGGGVKRGSSRVPQPADIAHLLRRAGFGGTSAQIATLASQPWTTTVDQLLDFSAAPADVEPTFLTDDIGDWEKEYKLQQWWLDRMATSTSPLQEKLTFFWHGHFATANYKVADMRLMYLQNALFRQKATGDFLDLTQTMSLQPAMLIWLDNDPNTKGHPNENFARELMELFTIGVGNYTQADIVASARAWTGHNTLNDDRTQYHFYPDRHDNDPKTFMGVTQNWDGPDIINFLLRDDATRRMMAAKYISKKMWSFFAYPNPDDTIVTTLANAFIAADLSIAELVRAIFNHTEFLSTAAKQGLVRSPVEWIVAVMRAVNMTADDANPQWWMGDMGQQLFQPPNVSGWRPNEYWLTTSRAWARANWSRYIIWPNDGAVGDTLSAIVGMTVPDAVQYTFDVLGVDNPTTHTRTKLEAWLTAQRAASAWVNWSFINLLTLVMLSPEMNLA